MKNIFNTLIIRCCFLIAFTTLLAAQAMGKVLVSQSLESQKMHKEMKYSIVLPETYDQSNQSYPVIYLLHGVSGNEQSWVYGGDVQFIADQWYKTSGKEYIIVIPDGGNYWYMNDAKGVSPYEDYFIQEFIPTIEKNYRIRSERSARFIAGLSMGGHGSLRFAVKYPKLFSKCYAMSPGIFTDEEFATLPADRYKKYGLNELLGELEGTARLNDFYHKNMILDLIKPLTNQQLSGVKYVIDCGDDDFLLFGNMSLMQLMRSKEMSAEFRIRDGAHNWTYWKESLRMALPFFSE